jgi:hypothetical protein
MPTELSRPHTEEYTVKIIDMDIRRPIPIHPSFSTLNLTLAACRPNFAEVARLSRRAAVQGSRFLRKPRIYLQNHTRCTLKGKLYLSLCPNGQSRDQSKLSPTGNQRRNNVPLADRMSARCRSRLQSGIACSGLCVSDFVSYVNRNLSTRPIHRAECPVISPQNSPFQI